MKQKFDDLSLEDKQRVIWQVKTQKKLHLLKHNTEVEIINGQLRVYLGVPLKLEREKGGDLDG